MVASQEASDKKAKAKARKVMPFEEDDRILLLGEGELTLVPFTAVLAAHPSIRTAHDLDTASALLPLVYRLPWLQPTSLSRSRC